MYAYCSKDADVGSVAGFGELEGAAIAEEGYLGYLQHRHNAFNV